jgi:hypothetical protein
MFAFIKVGRGFLTMSYFDNFDNKFLNKYKKIKIKKFIDMSIMF